MNPSVPPGQPTGSGTGNAEQVDATSDTNDPLLGEALEDSSPATATVGELSDKKAELNEIKTGARVIPAKAVPDVDEILEAQKDRRIARKYLAIGLGGMALLFFLGLFIILCFLLSGESIAIISHASNARGLTVISLALAVLSGVGLSLMLALVRISSDPAARQNEEEKRPMITTAIAECCKAVIEGVRSVRR